MHIIKETGVDLFTEDGAVGSLLATGMSADQAAELVQAARRLIDDYGAAAATSEQVDRLFEHIQAGNTAAAISLVKSLPKVFTPSGPVGHDVLCARARRGRDRSEIAAAPGARRLSLHPGE
ncbi:MAG: hypothetical protein HY698_17420 [Deltaproteobacteria bacterium]|nr:hypothetical protein [Deltaproteobacteria bacterium]